MMYDNKKVFNNIVETIGNTPLVKLNKITNEIGCTVLVKLEFFNPGGSIKDRIGISMIEAAEKQGLIKPGYAIVEPTSGNTGIGLALTALTKGYKIIFTIPDKMSSEKINLLKALGARVIITPTAVPTDHPAHYVRVAERIAKDEQNTFMPNQYFNPANPEIHYKTTGPEIWEQTDGKVDVLVAGIGTGGTITGTGKYLKEKKPKIRIVGVDPEGSMYHHEMYGTKGETHPYKVEGIGEDFMPSTFDIKIVDEIVVVSDRDAFLLARKLATEEGIFSGGSAGAAVFAALQVAKSLKKGQTVVVILPDTGRNYLSKLYSDDWMIEHGFIKGTEETILVEEIIKMKSERIEGVISVKPGDSVETVVKLMERHDISQLPVVDDGGVQIGSVTEKELMEKLCKLCGKSKEKCYTQKIDAVMGPPLPGVNKTDRILNPFLLLKDRNAVVVFDNKKLVDVITTIDVINYLARREQ
jgi:cystathionine beta-synthase